MIFRWYSKTKVTGSSSRSKQLKNLSNITRSFPPASRMLSLTIHIFMTSYLEFPSRCHLSCVTWTSFYIERHTWRFPLFRKTSSDYGIIPLTLRDLRNFMFIVTSTSNGKKYNLRRKLMVYIVWNWKANADVIFEPFPVWTITFRWFY